MSRSSSSSISTSSSTAVAVVAQPEQQEEARGLPIDGTTRYYEQRSETLSVRCEHVFAECLDHQP